MVVKVPAGLHSAVDVPSNGVVQPGFDCYYTDRTDPNLASLRILTGSGLNRELNTALELGFWKRGF